ncbi:DUF3298 and DUF4163 domain-containing protein [Porphyromonadaceae bacterium OttesenSCG-928-L07]|nr:DUF3298 and DUF4163 domain-containing protein [Porphyromonadaceae bacterium OttesenSCG-928-L07]MDL2252098.1 DUF3298 and DUF4163 domain-containing protein [Odoribacter sp. OttesenSCG-928-J03]MDL2330845.1 DUF3298 and DUF4163 domain-containing protein [Odoribacter sp. OttesenSCG-928-A06]
MRDYLLLLATFVILLLSCSRSRIEVTKESVFTMEKHIKIDIERSLFFSENAELNQSLGILNAKISEKVDSILVSFNADFERFSKDLNSMPEALENTNFELMIRDSIFMLNDKFISIRFKIYSYEGGAHGMTNYRALNYDLDKQQFLEPEMILDYQKAAEINSLLAEYFSNDEGCFTELPTLDNGFEAFNTSDKAVVFTYPAYALGAYACGHAEVVIPKKELSEILLK